MNFKTTKPTSVLKIKNKLLYQSNTIKTLNCQSKCNLKNTDEKVEQPFPKATIDILNGATATDYKSSSLNEEADDDEFGFSSVGKFLEKNSRSADFDGIEKKAVNIDDEIHNLHQSSQTSDILCDFDPVDIFSKPVLNTKKRKSLEGVKLIDFSGDDEVSEEQLKTKKKHKAQKAQSPKSDKIKESDNKSLRRSSRLSKG
ncbi:hypothetical protein HK099_002425 [Clydaea vesicula]|uniref:Uncharacterized protein n=1 Tax=Clydaea vesicula TaxID=447962 RepID=A0AAD5U7F0_9FUNG|nr:hypothetical protein HK099_002425 [Clydaea vesicula]KAJ3394826.1 hypothetical protein HDU92_006492 [Lobulomyces angularis]